MTEDNSSQYLLGGMAVNCGYLTKEQYEQSYYNHIQTSPDTPYADFLVTSGMLTQEQVTYVQQVMAGENPAQPAAAAEEPVAAAPEPAAAPDMMGAPMPPEDPVEEALPQDISSAPEDVPMPPMGDESPAQEETGVGFDTPMPPAAQEETGVGFDTPMPPAAQEETGVGFDTPMPQAEADSMGAPMPPEEPAVNAEASPTVPPLDDVLADPITPAASSAPAGLSPDLPSEPPLPPSAEETPSESIPVDAPPLPGGGADEPVPAINKPFATSFGEDAPSDDLAGGGMPQERKVLSLDSEPEQAAPAAEIPEIPAEPVMPEIPAEPTIPEVPEIPAEPAVPDAPAAEAALEPAMPEIPAEPVVSETPVADPQPEAQDSEHAELIYADVTLANPDDPGATVQCRALVSTGVLQLCLPSDMITQLKLDVAGEAEIAGIDGSKHEYRIFGPVTCATGGKECTVAAVELPFKAQPLLGITPLRELGLHISLENCSLE